jgi:hypothetical protein
MALAMAPVAGEPGKPIVQQISEEITVVARRQERDIPRQITTFSEGVTATYGPSTVTADRLVVREAEEEQNATATGNVIVTDPDGTIQATSITFTWKDGDKGGIAENVVGNVAGTFFRARRGEITTTKWTFFDVEGTVCRNTPPLFLVRSPRLEFTPGKEGRVERPRVSLLGQRIATLPTQRFNLDPRTRGISLPGFSYKREDGLGVTWSPGVLLDERTSLQGSFASYKGNYPGFSAIASRSLLPPDTLRGPLTPRSDFGDRFEFGYFETVEIKKPDEEFRILTTPRASVSIGSFFNQGVPGRRAPEDHRYSKPIEAAYEKSGTLGPAAYLAQARVHLIRNQFTPYTGRTVLSGSAILPPNSVARNVNTHVRADTSLFLGARQFGWVRGTAGLTYQPVRQVRLGAALVQGFEAGRPEFPIDPLYAKGGVNLRADFNLGPTRISYMTKWDREFEWYDREYSLNQVIGCLEAFVLYRQNPQTYRVGLSLRLDQLADLIQRRSSQRTLPAIPATAPTVISSPDTDPPRK